MYSKFLQCLIKNLWSSYAKFRLMNDVLAVVHLLYIHFCEGTLTLEHLFWKVWICIQIARIISGIFPLSLLIVSVFIIPFRDSNSNDLHKKIQHTTLKGRSVHNYNLVFVVKQTTNSTCWQSNQDENQTIKLRTCSHGLFVKIYRPELEYDSLLILQNHMLRS